MTREKIIAQENNIRLVAMERQCGGTMKLLENYSNLDLTGNLNLELLEPGTLCKAKRVIQIWITLRSWRSWRLQEVSDGETGWEVLHQSDHFLGTVTFKEKVGCVKKVLDMLFNDDLIWNNFFSPTPYPLITLITKVITWRNQFLGTFHPIRVAIFKLLIFCGTSLDHNWQ